VDNKVETNQLPFPFNVRTSLIGWNLINFKEGEFKPNPQKSEQWNRGAYLVEGLGHCGTCHTPKNLIGGDKNASS
jgi:mono/diheme cytochrome c family protein